MTKPATQTPASHTMRTRRSTHGVDWPTLAVAVAVYAGYLALTYFFRDLPLWIAAPLGAIWLAWFGSLQHETIHDHPTPWRGLNRALGSAPLSLWIPYRLYRSSHLQHHRHGGRHLTDPDHDPESFYVPPGMHRSHGGFVSALLRANRTLAGRLTVGPALSVFRFWRTEARKAFAGDAGTQIIWVRHGMALTLVLFWTNWVCHIPLPVYVFLVVYPSMSLSHLRSFTEHRKDANFALRTVTVEAHPFWALLFLNNNLHIAHHAHPHIPWYRLPAAWRLMRARAVEMDLVIRGGYGAIIEQHLFTPVIGVEHRVALSAVSETAS